MNQASTETTASVQRPGRREGEPAPGDFRRHTARGAVVTSAFQIGIYGIGTVERLVVAAWLTRSQYGLWGILIASFIALSWLKQFGIGDKYIQQSEPDQERAFQKAFTIELCLSLAFFLVVLVAVPLFALAYGRAELIAPGLVLALAIPITAFQSPSWIPYRRMQYGRQRILTSIDPVTTMVLSIALTAAGMGYWGLIIGALSGAVAGALICTLTSAYPLRLRIDRQTIREYGSFSWPLFGFGLCAFVTVQGTLLVANRVVGLAGVGAIGLATNIAGMSDGVDSIVSQVLYPAVCATAERTSLLAEAFVKSNRVALMWAMPAMVGVALFAGDLVHFVLGDRWQPAVPLFVTVALACGVSQVAFNWSTFLRAVNNTRPIFLAALAEVAICLVIWIPAILALGLPGYAIGFACLAAGQVILRGYYMRRLFRGFSIVDQLLRAMLPTLPPAAAVLLLRALLPGQNPPSRALAELGLYVALAVGSTYVLERPLVLELLGYLRHAGAGRAVPVLEPSGPPLT